MSVLLQVLVEGVVAEAEEGKSLVLLTFIFIFMIFFSLIYMN